MHVNYNYCLKHFSTYTDDEIGRWALLRAMEWQHFSLYHSQTIDFAGIFTDLKSVSNSEFFKAFVRPLVPLASEPCSIAISGRTPPWGGCLSFLTTTYVYVTGHWSPT
jgi:hypothetical protein